MIESTGLPPSRIAARRNALEARRQEAAAQPPSAKPNAWAFIPSHYAWFFIGGVAALILYFDLVNPNLKTPHELALASLVMIVSTLPMTRFLAKGKTYQVPAMEAHCLFYAMSFGFAGFLPVPVGTAGASLAESDMARALLYTLTGLLALIVGYYVVGAKLWKSLKPFDVGKGISNDTLVGLAWTGCVAGAALGEAGRLLSTAALSQISSQIYSLGFFMLLILVLEKLTGLGVRVAFFLLVLPYQLLFNSGLSTGQLAGSVTLACWISLSLLRSWRRIPILLLAAAFVFFIIFQPVKFYVRTVSADSGGTLGPAEALQAYANGFQQTYGSSSGLIANRNKNFDNSFDRINHLVTLAAIIRSTPSSQPYMDGATYLPLVTKWIPRMFWPDKPMENLGNEWAVRYGFLAENDTVTSYNLPWLPEMYMNFGWDGIWMMFALGIFYQFLWVKLMSQPVGLVEYVVALGFAQSLVFAESNFSLQAGGVIIFALLLWFLGMLLKFLCVYSLPSVGNRRNPAGSRPL